MLRWLAFAASCIFLLAVAWGMATVRAPRGLDLQYPLGKAEAAEILRGGADAHRPAVEADQVFIPIYCAQFGLWVLWIAFGADGRDRVPQAAAVGAVLMLAAGAASDYAENGRLFAALDAWGRGEAAWSAHDLGPLRVACARKWGHLGLALVLAGIANGWGRWIARDFRWDARRLRTLACVGGGTLGLAGAVFGLRGLFAVEGLSMLAVALTVAWEAHPRR
jgi:hypothetical protein